MRNNEKARFLETFCRIKAQNRQLRTKPGYSYPRQILFGDDPRIMAINEGVAMERYVKDTDDMECRLRKDAKKFLQSMHEARLKPHNSESILLRLTGKRFDDLQNFSQIRFARSEVETALMRERKKAKMKHRDYDLNRHIALHQAKKSLDDMAQLQTIAINDV